MGRKKTELCEGFVKPMVGGSFTIRNKNTGEIHRCRSLAHRDFKKNPEIGPIAKYSGDEPFFLAQIFKKDTIMKFLCGAQHETVTDETGEWEWMNLSLKDARSQGMEIHSDVEKKVKKVKVTAPSAQTETEVETLSETEETEEEVSEEPAAEVVEETEEVSTEN